ncbi:MAG: GNAT family N-acetyltransferase, partial [Oscillospiraceae bacterium]
MENISYSKLTKDNFNDHSLDGFIRHQEVRECWRKVNGEWTLQPIEFTEDWDSFVLREKAAEIIGFIGSKGFAYGAFSDDKIVGFITVSDSLFGSNKQYAELVLFQVSEPFRGRGIGRRLFELACEEARSIGVQRLYISAHSSKESQAAYRRLGCTEAEEVNKEIAENEPFDVQ